MSHYSSTTKEAEDVAETYRRKFNTFDLNKDGVISVREFAAVSRVMGFKLSKEDILEIFEKPDMEKTGINLEEFIQGLQKKSGNVRRLAPFREKYRRYDTKKRGCITSEEAYPVLSRELGFDMHKTETFIDIYDKNKDYEISLLEFVEFEKRVEQLKSQIMASFREFDQNGDGFVDAREMMMRGFTPSQVNDVIARYDADNDGKLNYGEFAAFYNIPIF